MSLFVTFEDDDNQRNLLTLLSLKPNGQYDYLELKDYLELIISSSAEPFEKRNAAIKLNADLTRGVEKWGKKLQLAVETLEAEHGKDIVFSANNVGHVTSLTVPAYGD